VKLLGRLHGGGGSNDHGRRERQRKHRSAAGAGERCRKVGKRVIDHAFSISCGEEREGSRGGGRRWRRLVVQDGVLQAAAEKDVRGLWF
jgi:hypothetical protein